MTYFSELKKTRQSYIELIDKWMWTWRIDHTELGWEYFVLQSDNCNCIGSPEEQAKWHTIHISKCLTSWDEIYDFFKRITALIEENSRQFKIKKEQAIERIEAKDITGTCFNYMKHGVPILDCTNSEELTKKEEETAKEIEQLSSQAKVDEDKRKKQEEKNERLRKEQEKEWEKFRKESEEWIKKTNKEIEEDKKRQQTEKPNSQRQEEEKEFLRLISLIKDCQDLTTLEKNYQIVKNNSLYTSSKETFVGHGGDNKTRLDSFYTTRKSSLQPKNHLDPSTQPQPNKPLIDITKTEQIENIQEAIAAIKNQVSQFLKKNNLKNSDLPKKCQNWEEQLAKLDSKEKIYSLASELNKQIENKSRNLKRGQNQKSNKQQPTPLFSKIFLGIVISIVILGIIFLSRRLIRRMKTKR